MLCWVLFSTLFTKRFDSPAIITFPNRFAQRWKFADRAQSDRRVGKSEKEKDVGRQDDDLALFSIVQPWFARLSTHHSRWLYIFTLLFVSLTNLFGINIWPNIFWTKFCFLEFGIDILHFYINYSRIVCKFFKIWLKLNFFCKSTTIKKILFELFKRSKNAKERQSPNFVSLSQTFIYYPFSAKQLFGIWQFLNPKSFIPIAKLFFI